MIENTIYFRGLASRRAGAKRQRRRVIMGYGFGRDEKGKEIRWGYSSVSDWFDSVILSFPAPWKVAALDGKYYGTEIEDARGIRFVSFWVSSGEPSARQKGDMTDEEWNEYCCDSHWESAIALDLASAVVRCRNIIAENCYYSGDQEADLLRRLILEHGRWEEDIDDEIKCGGPDRRQTSTEHDTHDQIGGMSNEYRSRLKKRLERVCKSCGELRKA